MNTNVDSWLEASPAQAALEARSPGNAPLSFERPITRVQPPRLLSGTTQPRPSAPSLLSTFTAPLRSIVNTITAPFTGNTNESSSTREDFFLGDILRDPSEVSWLPGTGLSFGDDEAVEEWEEDFRATTNPLDSLFANAARDDAFTQPARAPSNDAFASTGNDSPYRPVLGEEDEGQRPALNIIRRGIQVAERSASLDEAQTRYFGIHYRVLARIELAPEHRFNNAVQFEPAADNGDEQRLVNDVIAHRLNACLDVQHMSHEFRGRFHTLCTVDGRNVTLNAQREALDDFEIPLYEPNDDTRDSVMNPPMHVHFVCDFSVQTVWNSSFGTLSFATQSVQHNLFSDTIAAAIDTLILHINTGALGGYDWDLVRLRFDRFSFLFHSSNGVLGTTEGNDLRPANFHQQRLGHYDIDELARARLHNNDDFIARVRREYLAAVNARIQLSGTGSENDDSDLVTPDALTRDQKILRRVDKLTVRFLPRVLYDNSAGDVDLTSFPLLVDNFPPEYALQRNAGAQPRVQINAQPENVPLDLRRPHADPYIQGDVRPQGCVINKREHLEAALKRLAQLWCPPNTLDNNCFLDCLQHAVPDGETTAQMRAFLNHSNHVTTEDMDRLGERRNEQYYLYRIQATPYAEKTLAMQLHPQESRISQRFVPAGTHGAHHLDTRHVHILTHHSHSYLILELTGLLRKVKCQNCHAWLNIEGFSKHTAKCLYCQDCRKSHQDPQHKCGPSDRRLTPREATQRLETLQRELVCEEWVPMKPVKKGKKITTPRKIFFADLEALPGPNGFEPYAAGLLCLSDYQNVNAVEIFYGHDCMTRFFERLDQIKGRLYYFNGSAFDNFLHLKAMVNEERPISNEHFLKHGERIMCFQHHPNLSVADLYLFTRSPGSKSDLASTCKAWGVPDEMCKKDFDHDKIRDWDSVDEHREEVTEYLRYDVIALAHLFKNYQQAMWDNFSMDMNSCISPAQYAIQVWSADNPFLHECFVPHKGKEESDDRAAYYGGRVMCQRQQYQSQDWVEGQQRHRYADVDDYLIMGDVNSLYPAAQFRNKFAYGKWRYITEEKEETEGEFAQAYEDLRVLHWRLYEQEDGESVTEWSDEEDERDDRIARRVYRCDVTCPKDLLTAFLVERDENGSGGILQTLHDKTNCWYWGCELREAILLGYKVTRLYEVKEFEKLGSLFHDYVSTCWEGRKRSPKGSAQNLAFKFALNSLTGKFGQRAFETNSAIYSTKHSVIPRQEKAFKRMLARVVDFTPMFTDAGYNNAIILELKNENTNPSYPIYLSAQILAYARVLMSNIMRNAGCYVTPERAMYYTDTDSLVLPSACLEDLIDYKWIGKELGQMKCDLNDGFSDPRSFAKILRGCWAATKGPYSLQYVLPGEDVVREKVRVKGIPHPDAPFEAFAPLRIRLDTSRERLVERMKRWMEHPFEYELPCQVIGQRFYWFKSLVDNDDYFSAHINFDIIQRIMQKKGELYAYYGGMKRCFENYRGEFLLVRPDAVRRMACRTDWWKAGKRCYTNESIDNTFELSFPPGYVK